MWSVIKETSDIIWIVCYKLTAVWTSPKLFISWQFWESCGVINCGSGWRKDVVNQCLEFMCVCACMFVCGWVCVCMCVCVWVCACMFVCGLVSGWVCVCMCVCMCECVCRADTSQWLQADELWWKLQSRGDVQCWCTDRKRRGTDGRL